MRTVLAILMVLHGIAHGVGFAVPWGLIEPEEEMGYTTALLGGRYEVGDAGMRALGVVWLGLGLAFVVAGAGAWLRQSWWTPMATGVAVVSLAMSVLHWPVSRIGIAVNVVILILLAVGSRYQWMGL